MELLFRGAKLAPWLFVPLDLVIACTLDLDTCDALDHRQTLEPCLPAWRQSRLPSTTSLQSGAELFQRAARTESFLAVGSKALSHPPREPLGTKDLRKMNAEDPEASKRTAVIHYTDAPPHHKTKVGPVPQMFCRASQK